MASSGLFAQSLGSTVLAFSMTGGSIPAGCGTLVNLSLSGDATGITNIVVSDATGGALPFVYYDGGGSSDISGCMDMGACNYDADANVDDDSCEYPDNGDYSLIFDGADDYVEILHNGNLKIDDLGITVSVWIDSFNSDEDVAIIDHFGNTQDRWSLRVLGDQSIRFFIREESENFCLIDSQDFSLDNNNHLITIVFDSTNQIGYIYIDSTLNSSTQCNEEVVWNVYPNEIFQIGNYGDGLFMNALIDDISIISDILNIEEIYEYYSENYSFNEDLIAHWKFNENGGDYIYDHSGDAIQSGFP
jgi:hypothetical protein